MRKIDVPSLVTVMALSLGFVSIHTYYQFTHNPRYHGKRLNAWVQEVLWSKDPAARRQAAQVLGEAMDHEKGQMRQMLMSQLTQLGPQERLPQEVTPLLVKALCVEEESLWAPATTALTTLTGPEVVPALISVLNTGTSSARVRAAAVLGQLGPKAVSATKALRKAKEDGDERVRQAAADALEQIRSVPGAFTISMARC
jgi:HEAT repeat protein